MPRLTPEQHGQLLIDYQNQSMTIAEIAKKFSVSLYYPIELARKAGLPHREASSNPDRASRRKWETRNPEKRKAHRAVEYALATGTLSRQPCECGCDRKPQAHHDDYKKPLDVRWLCQKAHKAVHAQS